MHRYVPCDSRILNEPNAHLLFQEVANHYLACAGNSFENTERLEAATSEVALVWRLWLFLASIGGGGVCDFLANHCFTLKQLQSAHADLATVGAGQMRELLEAAIRLTVDTNYGEYLDDSGAREWSTHFFRKPSLSAEELNSKSMQLAAPATSEVVAAFIRTNRHRF